jgi:hypothetical protein
MRKTNRVVSWVCLYLVLLACLSCSLGSPIGYVDEGAIARAASAAPTKNPARTATVPDPGQVGPYAVGHTSLMLSDPTRPCDLGPRPIPVEVFFPVDLSTITASTPEAVFPLDPIGGRWPTTVSSEWELYGNDKAYEEPLPSSAKPFPLVVFSPGWGDPIWGHNFLAGRLASHGFVMAVMYHYGDGFFPWQQFDHIATASLNRPQDVSFVLNHLLFRNAEPGDLLEGLMDPERVAASGWSLGGYASMVLAAGIDNVGDFFAEPAGNFMGDPPPETLVGLDPDPRIKVILPIDGSNQVLRFHELARVSIPSMGIGEEWSGLATAMNIDPSWQARQHAAFQGHPSYRVDVGGTDHFSFSNLLRGMSVALHRGIIDQATYDWWCAMYGSAPLANSESNRLAAKYAIAFLQTVLAGKPGYQDILTPGHALTREQHIEFFVTEKRNPNSIEGEWPAYFTYFKHQPGSEQAKAEREPKATMPIPHVGLRR